MKITRGWLVSSGLIVPARDKPRPSAGTSAGEAARLRSEKEVAARQELSLRKMRAQDGISDEGPTKSQKIRKKQSKRREQLRTNLDWHIINNDR